MVDIAGGGAEASGGGRARGASGAGAGGGGDTLHPILSLLHILGYILNTIELGNTEKQFEYY